MSITTPKKVIGRVEKVSFPELGLDNIPARIDTGARTTAIWVSSAAEKNGKLEVVFLGKKHPLYTGEVITFNSFERVMVSSSNGQTEERYKVKALVKISGKLIRARLTLADRSTQVYPVLVGRNVLRGKFLVDVKSGQALVAEEKIRSRELQSRLREKTK